MHHLELVLLMYSEGFDRFEAVWKVKNNNDNPKSTVLLSTEIFNYRPEASH